MHCHRQMVEQSRHFAVLRRTHTGKTAKRSVVHRHHAEAAWIHQNAPRHPVSPPQCFSHSAFHRALQLAPLLDPSQHAPSCMLHPIHPQPALDFNAIRFVNTIVLLSAYPHQKSARKHWTACPIRPYSAQRSWYPAGTASSSADLVLHWKDISALSKS